MINGVRFCEKCGEKLSFRKKFSKYDKTNGRKIFHVYGYCPCGCTHSWVTDTEYCGMRINYYEAGLEEIYGKIKGEHDE